MPGKTAKQVSYHSEMHIPKKQKTGEVRKLTWSLGKPVEARPVGTCGGL